MVDAIYWDNDGVLVDTEHIYFECTRDVMATCGIELTPEQYVEHFLVQGQGTWHIAARHGATPIDIERLRADRNALYSRRLAEAPRTMPGIAEVLDSLHGRYTMGIVTSSRRDHFDVIHQSTGLLKYFDFVVTADDVTRTKPAAEPYLRAIQRTGGNPARGIAIEDSERGLIAATAAGVRCVVVPSGMNTGRAFPAARKVLSSVSEIPAAIAELTYDLGG